VEASRRVDSLQHGQVESSHVHGESIKAPRTPSTAV